MTPLALELLIWSFNRNVNKDAQPHFQFNGFSAPDDVADVALGYLLERELLQVSIYSGVFGVTPRGEALVRTILGTPLPERRWVDRIFYLTYPSGGPISVG